MSSDLSKKVCVTGANGFIASWLIKELLERGYTVHGTVRKVVEEKVAHLRSLPGATAETLKLFEADLLAEGSFDAAIAGCGGVFHTASPFFWKDVTDGEKQFVIPAVEGTKNVLNSCLRHASTVQRVVVTSSTAAVFGKDVPASHVFTEEDWSDDVFQRQNGRWYALSKTLAERAAWAFVEEHKPSWSMSVINPTMVGGPMIQPELNTSNSWVLAYLDGTNKQIPNYSMSFVDVRDVALSHVVAYEKNESVDAEGRHLCMSCSAPVAEIVELIRSIVKGTPLEEKVPVEIEGQDKPDFELKPASLFDNGKLKRLGVEFKPLEEIMRSTIQSMQEKGFLNKKD